MLCTSDEREERLAVDAFGSWSDVGREGGRDGGADGGKSGIRCSDARREGGPYPAGGGPEGETGCESACNCGRCSAPRFGCGGPSRGGPLARSQGPDRWDMRPFSSRSFAPRPGHRRFLPPPIPSPPATPLCSCPQREGRFESRGCAKELRILDTMSSSRGSRMVGDRWTEGT